MMRRAAISASGLFLVVAAIVAIAILAPATTLDAALAAQTGGAWRLADARGLWWRGGGVLSSRDGVARMPLGWRIAWLPLAQGTLSIDLFAADGGRLGTIDLGRNAWSLHDLRLRLPAAFAVTLAPRMGALAGAGALAAGGELDLRARAFEWNASGGSGTLDAQWNRARLVVAGTTVDFGTVVATLAARQGRLQGTVHGTGGDLAVDGTIGGSGSSIGGTLTLRPLPTSGEALRRSLPLLGAQDGSGAVHIDWHAGR
ncbi:MAG: type II secretion system protein N [Betaproteobacteria bacterium]|nr:type II secretion system protein N [Betaproteobacteria bacterium]MDE2358114.1 type II secretion system protein N [Betaproteobacteria bacterium]